MILERGTEGLIQRWQLHLKLGKSVIRCTWKRSKSLPEWIACSWKRRWKFAASHRQRPRCKCSFSPFVFAKSTTEIEIGSHQGSGIRPLFLPRSVTVTTTSDSVAVSASSKGGFLTRKESITGSLLCSVKAALFQDQVARTRRPETLALCATHPNDPLEYGRVLAVHWKAGLANN